MNTEFKTKIDTEEITTDLQNVEELGRIDEDTFNYVKFKRITKSDKVVFVLHLSRFKARYDRNNYSFKEQMEAKENMLKQLGIRCIEETRANRIDICFDTEKKYKEMYKLNDCLMELYRLNYKERDSLDIRSKKMRRSTAMRCKTRHSELYIYDKEHESHGLHPYSTRVEFRFKDVQSEEKQKIKGLTELLSRLIENMETFEYLRAEDLHRWYLQDLEEKKIKSFAEFVRHNADHITTYKTLELLYKKIGMRGTAKRWVDDYRKKNPLEFVTKKDMSVLIADMKKSLKEYVKN